VKTSEPGERLELLLAEPMAAVLERQQHALEEIIGSLDQQFILFGAGNLGRKALATLRGIGKEPAAFIDNQQALWGSEILGVPVLSPAVAAEKFDPARVGVITTIWCGEATDKMSDRVEPLSRLGFRNIAMFGHLAWKFPDEFLPHYCLDLPSKVIAAAAQIRSAFALLGDDASRELFVDHIEWRLFLVYDVLPYPSPLEIYFNDSFVNYCQTEVLYDIGAYIGDSAESFLKTERGREFSQIHSFEPSPDNFLKLSGYLDSLGELRGRVFAHQLALGDCSCSIQVEVEHGPASRVGSGEQTVSMTTIDEFSRSYPPPSFIKIDIEGFEPECLAGARQTITSLAPVVAVCVYHQQSHIWDIMLQLESYRTGYRYSLCPHLADGWDLVLYAVPEQRLPA